MPPFQDLEEIPLEPKPFHPTVTWMLGLAILALGAASYLAAAELQFYVSAAVATDADTAAVIEGEYGTAQSQSQTWLSQQKAEDEKTMKEISDRLGYKLPSQKVQKAQPAAAGGRGGAPAR